MRFITQAAHAGHDHSAKTVAGGHSMSIVFGGIIVVTLIAAAVLVALNARKKPAGKQ